MPNRSLLSLILLITMSLSIGFSFRLSRQRALLPQKWRQSIVATTSPSPRPLFSSTKRYSAKTNHLGVGATNKEAVSQVNSIVDPWKSLQDLAGSIKNPMNVKVSDDVNEPKVVSPYSFKGLSNRRTWKLLPVPPSSDSVHGDDNEECKWVLLVSKRTVFNSNDTDAVMKLHDEIKQCDYDFKNNTFTKRTNNTVAAATGQSQHLSKKNISRISSQLIPPWLLVVLVGGGDVDYRAAALLRMSGLDVWPMHRFNLLTSRSPLSSIALSTKQKIKEEESPTHIRSSSQGSDKKEEDRSKLLVNTLDRLKGKFEVVAPYEPTGDQPEAIAKLCEGLQKNDKKFQTLMGATGTGKTFMMAKVIENYQRPTLVLAPNKVLAAQLYNELASFFPNNAVEYFVSFYDYYLPESYSPVTDKFVDKVIETLSM
jgi:hypothetical protein